VYLSRAYPGNICFAVYNPLHVATSPPPTQVCDLVGAFPWEIPVQGFMREGAPREGGVVVVHNLWMLLEQRWLMPG